MENMEMRINDNILTITVDLRVELGPSGSKKNMIIASTRGNAKIPGTNATIGLNIYKALRPIAG